LPLHGATGLPRTPARSSAIYPSAILIRPLTALPSASLTSSTSKPYRPKMIDDDPWMLR
jgi:hypothetical protein